MSYRIGIDTGGTFTDLVVLDDSGDVALFKTPSTPEDPPRAIREGLDQVAEHTGLSVGEMLSRCEMLIHGTTVALNALLQLQGSKTGLLCTRGHEDTLEIRLGHKEDGHRYDFGYPAATPLVPRYLRMPVTERVNSAGEVLTELNEEDVLRAIEIFRKEAVEAVGVCFLWSFLRPEHERRVGALLATELPDVHVTLSVDLLPQIRDYTRTSTVAVNAYIGPKLTRYIAAIEAMLRDLGYTNPIRYVQSNGGLTSGRLLAQKAAAALNSGPAAGPGAGLFFATRSGERSLLTLDVGGTSSDISLMTDGRVDLAQDIDIGRYRVGLPLVNVVSIGAGGGSIAAIDSQGILRVGPQSAEAQPGPACYQRGGTRATVTDSLVVLGYLNQEALLGGKLPISASAAREAIETDVGRPLGLDDARAADGIFRVANANMVAGIRMVSVERGYDPRDFVMVIGGGATGAHAAHLAEELGMRTVLVPKVASGLCAFGEAIADAKHTYLASYPTPLPDVDPARLESLFTDLEQQGRSDLESEGFTSAQMRIERTVAMKYIDQVHECSVEIPRFEITRDRLGVIADAFHKRHEALYTYSESDNVPELINVEVTVYGASPVEPSADPPLEAADTSSGALVSRRDAYFREDGEGYRPVPVFDGNLLPPGSVVAGPAIVEEPTTTLVVPPGWRLALVYDDLYRLEAAGE